MWQLRERWQSREPTEAESRPAVRVGSSRLGRFLPWAVMLGMAVCAGGAAYRFIHPLSSVTIGLATVGGAALGFLLLIVPRQAMRVLRRMWIGVGVVRRRRLVRALARRGRARLLKTPPEDLTAALIRDLAVADYLRGLPGEAEDQLVGILGQDEDAGGIANDLGVVLAAQGQYERAAEFFVRALGSEADHHARVNCALVAPLVATPSALEEMLRTADKIPGAVALNNLGVSYARRENWDRAAALFHTATTEDPGLPAALANLGLLAYRRGELQQAADQVTAADRLAPHEATFATYLGAILASDGQFDQARYYLKRALRVDPANAAVRLTAMAVEARAGRLPLAVRGLEDLVEDHPAMAAAHYNLALARLNLGEPMAASAAAAAAIAAGDGSPEAYTALAVALWETGRRAEALSHFQAAADAGGASPLAVSNLGRALLLEGQSDRARALLERGHTLWPDDLALAFDLATAVLAAGAAQYHDGLSDDRRAKLALTIKRSQAGLEATARRGNGLGPEAHVNLGLYLYMEEQYERAADHFEEALRLGPKARELQLLIGTALGRAGEENVQRVANGAVAPVAVGRQLLRRAVPYLEQAAEDRELMADANYNLGRCLYVLEDFERALTAFRKALGAERTEEMYTLAALAAARQGQELQMIIRGQLMLADNRREALREQVTSLMNTAVHYFTQALSRNENNPTLHGNLGIAYMLRNRDRDIESALRHWERMRAIGGGAVERRYEELAQIGSMADAARVAFDDRDLNLRGLDVRRWLAVPPPHAGSYRFLLEPMAVNEPWRVVVETPELCRALALQTHITEGEVRLARLRV